MALKESLVAEFDHEMASTRKLLERIPADRLPWKPHERSRSFAELAQHVAFLPNWATLVLDRAVFDLEELPPHPPLPQNRQELVSAFEEARARARKVLDKTDAEFAARWTLRRGGQELFTMPRLMAFRSFVLNHLIHHRGQLSVYLRLNDVHVPAIYGPSADEGQ